MQPPTLGKAPAAGVGAGLGGNAWAVAPPGRVHVRAQVLLFCVHLQV